MTTTISKKHYNILLADDESAVTKTVSFVLKRAGHTIESVPDGDLALEKITSDPQQYDVLITDHSMKRMSGLELVERLHDTGFSSPIIVLSGNLTLAIEEAYQAAGVTRFIYKPFEVQDLNNALESLPG